MAYRGKRRRVISIGVKKHQASRREQLAYSAYSGVGNNRKKAAWRNIVNNVWHRNNLARAPLASQSKAHQIKYQRKRQ